MFTNFGIRSHTRFGSRKTERHRRLIADEGITRLKVIIHYQLMFVLRYKVWTHPVWLKHAVYLKDTR